MSEVNLIVVGLLFIDGNSALTWTLAWSYWTKKHLHGVSLLVSELHFSHCLKDALALLSSSVRVTIRHACSNSNARGHRGKGRTGPCLLLTSSTLKMGK